MTNERPLAAISDELDRVLKHVDSRFDHIDTRLDGLSTQAATTIGRLDGLTVQVTTTNGRVTKLEMWKEYLNGVKAGAGGSWGIIIGACGLAFGAVGAVVAIVSLT
jgi:hypothetical protein